MIGRVMRLAVLAGAGTLAWRWWQHRQAEDREYSQFEPPASTRSGSGAAGTSPMESRAEQVPAQ
jgi:predicted negative regulator of RcsB-dependent stress response